MGCIFYNMDIVGGSGHWVHIHCMHLSDTPCNRLDRIPISWTILAAHTMVCSFCVLGLMVLYFQNVPVIEVRSGYTCNIM